MSRALLLDEMLSPAIADRLREPGHDVVAAVAQESLRSFSDADLLGYAADDHRCLVTCNVRDFLPIARAWAALGQSHAGIICIATSTFTQNRGFPGRVVQALDTLLVSGDLPPHDGIWFLSAPEPASGGH